MNKGFWQSDWFAGVAITLIFLLFSSSAFIASIERSAYDFGVRASNKKPSDKIAVIAIDDESIANLGRWPWSRDIHAEMINLLANAGAKVIGHTVFFLEPQEDPGLSHIKQMIAHYRASNINNLVVNLKKNPELSSQADDIVKLINDLLLAEKALNTDKILADSMARAKNVVLGMPFLFGSAVGRADQELPEYVSRNTLKNITDRINALGAGQLPQPAIEAIYPIYELGTEAAGIGNLVSFPDIDGGIRLEPLVVDYYGENYPSLALILAAKSLNLGLNDILIQLGEGIQLGGLSIRTDDALRMHTFYYSGRDNGQPAFQVDSFFDVLSGKIPASKYRDKVVLIGATATGVGSTQVTPINPAMSPVLTLAHTVSSILKEDFFIVPEWAKFAWPLTVLFVAAYLIAVLPRLKAAMAFIITALLLFALFLTHYVLMTQQGYWLELMFPGLLLLTGHLLLTTKRFLITEKGKLKSDFESAESNRMLGLSFQGQGQLDMAFEKFRKIPVDKSVLELLYNLGLDYERKRQFNKAGSVYGYMAEYAHDFKDIEQRMSRTKAMEETVILGGASASSSPGGTLILGDSGVQKPMLGRYEVEKELGKGAMGAVYLGKDPKISRVVAIKTMALSQEFEEDELQDVKNRFFREAETAGRLSHPNIVTIYDAGEEHDLAYIAMEFLKGKDLVQFTRDDNLLPLLKVINLIARSADALEYAHQQNVVHRDIKPANIMYEPESDTLKITDFGIARITDSSKTKTGMVLGTPSYMSPEQLAGKRVDGRSDLFSLGVMFFQLVTGELPFQADSMATLMYKIANEPHPDPVTIRKGLPRCITIIVNRALAKNVDKRYQRAAQMASDLRKCAQIIMKAAQQK